MDEECLQTENLEVWMVPYTGFIITRIEITETYREMLIYMVQGFHILSRKNIALLDELCKREKIDRLRCEVLPRLIPIYLRMGFQQFNDTEMVRIYGK